jgi:hypothetical protein
VIEPLGRFVRKPAQQSRINDCKNRRARANAEGQRHHGNQGEAGLLQQRANGIAQVLQQFVHLSFSNGYDLKVAVVLGIESVPSKNKNAFRTGTCAMAAADKSAI